MTRISGWRGPDRAVARSLFMLLLLVQGCEMVPVRERPGAVPGAQPIAKEAQREPLPEQRPDSPGRSAATQLREEALRQLDEGDTQRAAAQLERSIRIDPNGPDGYFHLARVRILEGLYDEARELLLQARALLDSTGVRSGELWSETARLLAQVTLLQSR